MACFMQPNPLTDGDDARPIAEVEMLDQNELHHRKLVLEHSASWSDVRTALYLTLAMLVVAAGLVLLSPGVSYAPTATDEPGVLSNGSLAGVRHPSRPGWHAPNGAWNTLGTHEAVGSFDEVPDAEDEAKRR
jgi:hypothetical protein